jgi:hypothetical protein
MPRDFQLTAGHGKKDHRRMPLEKHSITHKYSKYCKLQERYKPFLWSSLENIKIVLLAEVKINDHTLKNFPQMHGCTSHNLN